MTIYTRPHDSTTHDYTTQSFQEAVAYLPFIYLSFAGIGSIAVKPIVKKLNPMVSFYSRGITTAYTNN